MKLSELFAIFPQVQLIHDADVTALCFDSRVLTSGCVYVAIAGTRADGHDYLAAAVKAGAVALVVESRRQIPHDYNGIVLEVASTRDALNKLAARWEGEPARALFCVGVTGTNGKTTTTYLTEAILSAGGLATGVIGTIDHHLTTSMGAPPATTEGKIPPELFSAPEKGHTGRNHIWKTEMTTPDPLAFQKRLREFVDLGAKAVALEVSSHALTQFRVDEVPFDVVQFTHLTRDHLDYHKDMEDYFQAKLRLFTELLGQSKKSARFAVINTDDPYGRRIFAALTSGARTANIAQPTVWRYGTGPAAELCFQPLEQGFAGTRFHLRTPHGEREFQIPMPGLHNVYNSVAAIGAGLAAGVSLDACASALESFHGVPGRLEAVPNKRGLYIFVDYAHTDDALKTVLHYLNAIRQTSGVKNRIITVFGCGGDRDKGKRPLMMKEAQAGSDFCVLTSDNPRTEDPEAILRDALMGAEPGSSGRTVFQETDRRQGIKKALELAQSGDVILIAGKGHEAYQQIGTVKHPFSDVQVVREILK